MASDEQTAVVELIAALREAADTINGLANLLREGVEAPDQFHDRATAIVEISDAAKACAKRCSCGPIWPRRLSLQCRIC